MHHGVFGDLNQGHPVVCMLRYFWHFQDVHNRRRVEFLGHLEYPTGPEHPLGRCTAAAAVALQPSSECEEPLNEHRQTIICPAACLTAQISRFGDVTTPIELQPSRIGLITTHAEALAASDAQVCQPHTLNHVVSPCIHPSGVGQGYAAL